MINHLFNSKVKIIGFALLLVSCGISIDSNDAKRTYKTLIKSSEWKVKKLTISKVDMSQTTLNPPVVWDTVFL
jgi:arginine exporter protein ArgO